MSGGGLKSILTTVACRGLTEARDRIFGHVINLTGQRRVRIFGHFINQNGQRSPHKILRKKLFGEKIAAWYLYDPKYDDPQVVKLEESERLSKL